MDIAHINQVSTTDQLARVLRQLRRREARRRGGAELTYRELAARTGWSVGLFAGYFGGRILPPTDRFDVLVGLLDAAPVERGALATARDRVQEGRRHQPPVARPPRQLPPASFRFAGRAAQLAGMDALIRSDDQSATGTIAVVAGTAGVGKTSLAVHWAHRVAHHFPDGQLFVDLRGFDPDRDPASAADTVRDFLGALGVSGSARPASDTAQAALYRSILADLRMLIVLDNARDADQVRPLLPGAPGCLTVVTSRNQLTSLVAVEGARQLVVDLMPIGDARALLAHRLGADRIAAEPDVADELIHGCARLPLALVVVAARAGARPDFPLAVVAQELRRARGSLDPFTGDDTTADARAAFACSYGHLGGAAAELFRRIGGHPGPDLTAPAAASLLGAPPERIGATLAELTHAHLVTEHVPGRYAVHDLLRTFAAEQAERIDSAAGRREGLARLLDHYLHTAFAAAVQMYPNRDRITLPPHRADVTPEPLGDRDRARRWLDDEHRVLVGAVAQAAAGGFHQHAWQLAWCLTDYLDWCGHWPDLAAVLRTGVDAAERAGDAEGRIQSLRSLARACLRLGRTDEARTHLDRAIELCRETGNLTGEAGCHINLSLALERYGRHRGALDHSLRALELFRAAGHRNGYALALGIIGWYHALLGEYGPALGYCQEALDLQRRLGGEVPSTIDSLGYAYHHLGRHDEAADAYRRAITLYRERGDRYHEADTLIHLGDSCDAAGVADQAQAAWRQALTILEDLRHPGAADLRSRCATGARPE